MTYVCVQITIITKSKYVSFSFSSRPTDPTLLLIFSLQQETKLEWPKREDVAETAKFLHCIHKHLIHLCRIAYDFRNVVCVVTERPLRRQVENTGLPEGFICLS